MSRKPRLRRGLFNTKSGRIRAKNQRIGGKIEGKRGEIAMRKKKSPPTGLFCFWVNSGIIEIWQI